jgi:hypothetical protein
MVDIMMASKLQCIIFGSQNSDSGVDLNNFDAV